MESDSTGDIASCSKAIPEILDKEGLEKLIRNGSEHVTFKSKEKASRSECWKTFKIVYFNNIQQKFVRCDLCKTLFAYDQNKASTSSLSRHAESTCTLLKATSSQPIITEKFKKKIPPQRKGQFNSLVALSLAEDLSPFYLVDHSGFRRIAQELIHIGAQYGPQKLEDILVSRRTLKEKYLLQKYEEKKNEIIADLQLCLSQNLTLSFTTDMWTDDNRKASYIGLTAHYFTTSFELKSQWLSTATFPDIPHSTDNIRDQMKLKFEELFQQSGQRVMQSSYFVTDSGSNIVSVFENRLSCSCHNLNLVVSHALSEQIPDAFKLKRDSILLERQPGETLKDFNARIREELKKRNAPLIKQWHDDIQDISSLISSVKEVVGYLKRSGKNSQLKSTVKQEVSTRWNSVWAMLNSVDKAYDQIGAVLDGLGKMAIFSSIDRKLLQEIILFLGQVKECSENLSGEQKPTLDLVAIWKEKLRIHCIPTETSSKQIKKLKERALKCLEHWMTVTDVHLIATILNPLYRKVKFISREKYDVIKTKIRKMLEDIPEPSSASNVLRSENTDKQSGPSERKKSRLVEFEDSDSDNEGELDELNIYLALPINKEGFDLCNFWRQQHALPKLTVLARSILSIPASSASSERLFSSSGFTLSSRRSQLQPGTVDQILLIHGCAK